MYLSIFSDELCLDLPETLPILRSWGLDHVDLRNRVMGKPFEFLTPDELTTVRRTLADGGFKVGCLQSSLAKVHLPDSAGQAEEAKKLDGILRAAEALDCRLARSFFYWQPSRKHGGRVLKEEEGGLLTKHPDMLRQVVDLYRPLAERAQAAGVTLALENCGATPLEIMAFLDALNMPNVKMAWDAWFWWDWLSGLGQEDDPDASSDSLIACVKRAACVHAKGRGVVDTMRAEKDGTPIPSVPYGRVLASLQAAGFDGPISAETGFRRRSGDVTTDESAQIIGASRQVIEMLRAEWPTAAPQSLYEAAQPAARKIRRPYESDPVRFVVVGLGKGHQRATEVLETPGAKLLGVCDLREERAKKTAKVCGVPYELDVRRWLDNKDVEVVYVMTPTGRHAEIATMALQAGKHVLGTKPMEVSLAACDEMIRLADQNKVLLGVDFQKRYETPITSLRSAVAEGWFGKLLGGKLSLQCKRDAAYFLESGGWRGTKRWDGGGVISNQAVHSIDQAAYTIGIPAKVRCDIWTQTHDIEGEDLAVGTWLYASGLVVTFYGTTSYTQQTWSPDFALYGTNGAFSLTYGGIWEHTDQHWFRDGEWTAKAPKVVEPEYANASDNFAAAVRLGVPLTCDGRDGRRTQSVIDAMFRSAYSGGGWVDVQPEYRG